MPLRARGAAGLPAAALLLYKDTMLRLALVLLLLAPKAFAQDRFEIQVYDSEVAGPLEPGLEVHLNVPLKGQQATSEGGELPTHHVLHVTFEPHLGVFGWGELGAYVQTALRPEGTLDFAGAKLRFKARVPDRFWGDRLGLAVNFEVSRVPERYEADVWGSEVRPIIDFREGLFYASFNPILATALQGAQAGHPELEPALKLALSVREDLALGVETYSGLGPLDAFLPASQQAHAVYLTADWTNPWFDVNLGVGRGLGTAEPWVVKAIVGVHPEVRRTSPAPGPAGR